MGSPQEHQAKAEHNQKFLRTIDPDSFADWVIVVAFYRAVHLVERLFVGLGLQNAHSHESRNARLKRDFGAIHRAFHPIYNVSMYARYHCNYICTRAKVEQEVLKTRLPEVERLVEAELARAKKP